MGTNKQTTRQLSGEDAAAADIASVSVEFYTGPTGKWFWRLRKGSNKHGPFDHRVTAEVDAASRSDEYMVHLVVQDAIDAADD